MVMILAGIIVIFLLAGTLIMGARQDGKNKDNDKSGFTLIELLAVIAIIALLATVVFVYLGGTTAKARDAKRLNDLDQLGRYLSFGCIVPDGGPGEYDLNDLLAEMKAKYPQYAGSIPANIRDPKTGTAGISNYTYILDSASNCVLYANLENPGAAVTLPALSAPTPRGGKGVLAGATTGVNGTDKYFQISN